MRTFVFIIFTICGIQGALDLSNYTPTWVQDFTRMRNLSVSANGPTGTAPCETTWWAHQNNGLDWVTFQNPSGNFQPFSLDGNVLTVRAQASNGAARGGMLNTATDNGQGYSFPLGSYVEFEAKLPAGPGAWPALWFTDVVSSADRTTYSFEIDLVEQYGNNPAIVHSALHFWQGGSSYPSSGIGSYTFQCNAYTGYHTYGFDYQADYLTFYYDRVQYWRVANSLSNVGSNVPAGGYNRNLRVMINNAPDVSGNEPDYVSQLAANPQDFKIKSVKVWSGTGGSSGTVDYSKSSTASFTGANWRVSNTAPFRLNGVTFQVNATGDFQVVSWNGAVLWSAGFYYPECASSSIECVANFQNDGNLVYYVNGQGKWDSKTGYGYPKQALGVILSNNTPYFNFFDGQCNSILTFSGPSNPPKPSS